MTGRALILIVSLLTLSLVIPGALGENVHYSDGVKTQNDDTYEISLYDWPTLTSDTGEVSSISWLESKGNYQLRAVTDWYDMSFKSQFPETLVNYENITVKTSMSGMVYDDYNSTPSKTISGKPMSRVSNQVTYSNIIHSDVDLEVYLSGSNIKETYVFNSPQAQYFTPDNIRIKSVMTTVMDVSINGSILAIDGWAYDIRGFDLLSQDVNWSVPGPLLYDVYDIAYIAYQTIHRTSSTTYDVWVSVDSEPFQTTNRYPLRLDPPLDIITTGLGAHLYSVGVSPGDQPYSLFVGSEAVVGFNPVTHTIIQTLTLSQEIYVDIVPYHDVAGGTEYLAIGYDLPNYRPIVKLFRVGVASVIQVSDISFSGIGWESNYMVPRAITFDNNDETGTSGFYHIIGTNDVDIIDINCPSGHCDEWVATLDWLTVTPSVQCAVADFVTDTWQFANYNNWGNRLVYHDTPGHVGVIDIVNNTDTVCSDNRIAYAPLETSWRGYSRINDADIDGGLLGVIDPFDGSTSPFPESIVGGYYTSGGNSYVTHGKVFYTDGQFKAGLYSLDYRYLLGVDQTRDGKIWTTVRDDLFVYQPQTGFLVQWSRTGTHQQSWFINGEQPAGLAMMTGLTGLAGSLYGNIVTININDAPQSYLKRPSDSEGLDILPALSYTWSPLGYPLPLTGRCYSNEIETHRLDIWVNLTVSPYTTIFESHVDISTSVPYTGVPYDPDEPTDYLYFNTDILRSVTYPGSPGTYRVTNKCLDPIGLSSVDTFDFGWYDKPLVVATYITPGPPGPGGWVMYQEPATVSFLWDTLSLLESTQGVNRWLDNNMTIRVYKDSELYDTLELGPSDVVADRYSFTLSDLAVGHYEAVSVGFDHNYYDFLDDLDSTGMSDPDSVPFDVYTNPLVTLDYPTDDQVFNYGDTLYFNSTGSSGNPDPVTLSYDWDLIHEETTDTWDYTTQNVIVNGASPGNYTLQVLLFDLWAYDSQSITFEVRDTGIYTQIDTPINSEDYPLGTNISFTSTSWTTYFYAVDNWTWTVLDLDTLEEYLFYGQDVIVDSLGIGNYSVNLDYTDGYKLASDLVAKFTVLDSYIWVNITSPITDQEFDEDDTVEFTSDYLTDYGEPVLNWTWLITNTDTGHSWTLTGRNVSKELTEPGDYTVKLTFSDGFKTISQTRPFVVKATSILEPGDILDNITDIWSSLGMLQYVLIGVVGVGILLAFKR